MSDLIAITYKEEDSALGALNELTQLQKERLIELEDAAVATMNKKGKVKVNIRAGWRPGVSSGVS